MEDNFKEFMKMMIICVLPVVLYFIVYSVLISLIPNQVIGGIVFVLSICPVFYFGLKLMYILMDVLEKFESSK